MCEVNLNPRGRRQQVVVLMWHKTPHRKRAVEIYLKVRFNRTLLCQVCQLPADWISCFSMLCNMFVHLLEKGRRSPTCRVTVSRAFSVNCKKTVMFWRNDHPRWQRRRNSSSVQIFLFQSHCFCVENDWRAVLSLLFIIKYFPVQYVTYETCSTVSGKVSGSGKAHRWGFVGDSTQVSLTLFNSPGIVWLSEKTFLIMTFQKSTKKVLSGSARWNTACLFYLAGKLVHSQTCVSSTVRRSRKCSWHEGNSWGGQQPIL